MKKTLFQQTIQWDAYKTNFFFFTKATLGGLICPWISSVGDISLNTPLKNNKNIISVKDVHFTDMEQTF